MKILLESNNEPIGWYQITKDIIIPLLGVISTLTIGIIIANLLRKKEEKSKIKTMLIDHYMNYLEARTSNVIFEINYSSYEILQGILLNRTSYLNSPTWPLSHDLILAKAAEYRTKSEESISQASDWTYYTYRFTFLLGKKTYFKKALPLEKEIEKNLLGDNSRKAFNNSLLEEIKGNEELIKGLNSNKKYDVECAITEIERLIAIRYNTLQFKFFNPYNEKIADLINDY